MNGSTNALRLVGNWRELPRRYIGISCGGSSRLLRLLVGLLRLAGPFCLVLCLPRIFFLLLAGFPLLPNLFELCSRDKC